MALRAWLSKPKLRDLWVPMLASAGIPLAIYFGMLRYYGFASSKATLLLDFCFLAYLSSVFLLFQRNSRLAIVPFVLVSTLPLVAAVEKYVMLNTWIRFSDLSVIDEAWAVAPLGQRIGLVTAVVVAATIAIRNRQRPNLRALGLLLVPLIAGATVLVTAPGFVVRGFRGTTNAVFGNDPLYRSVFFALAYDFADRMAFERESSELLARHGPLSASVFETGKITNKRNVHVFVLESFMDPKVLGITVDPFDPRFRSKLGGQSLSPVFGGRTSQAEFEILCGTPVYDFLDPVTFNDLRGHEIPALPSLLREQGYVTLSSTDVAGNFFNSREAYESLGFSKSRFREDFPTDDMDGTWVSADAHIAANKRLIAPLLAAKKPFLNYVLFVTGHVPYEMNPVKRPPVLHVDSTDEVNRLVNALYYNSKSIADYIDYLSEKDPNALVFVVGDHQGALASIERRSHWSRRFALDHYLIPYVFVDAGKVRRPGDIAHFDIPHLILASLLGKPYTRPAARLGVDWIRPIGRRAFYKLGSVVGLCPDGNAPPCPKLAEFQENSIVRWLQLIRLSRGQGR